jgi:hypothetical protein
MNHERMLIRSSGFFSLVLGVSLGVIAIDIFSHGRHGFTSNQSRGAVALVFVAILCAYQGYKDITLSGMKRITKRRRLFFCLNWTILLMMAMSVAILGIGFIGGSGARRYVAELISSIALNDPSRSNLTESIDLFLVPVSIFFIAMSICAHLIYRDFLDFFLH